MEWPGRPEQSDAISRVVRVERALLHEGHTLVRKLKLLVLVKAVDPIRSSSASVRAQPGSKETFVIIVYVLCEMIKPNIKVEHQIIFSEDSERLVLSFLSWGEIIDILNSLKPCTCNHEPQN